MEQAETHHDHTEFARAFAARLRALSGVANGFVALHEPEFGGAEWEFVKECLDTGWVSSVGAYVDRFEAEVARLSGATYGVAVVNGTAALQIALLLVGVGPGDEVIVPALSFVATANAAAHAGATPHFVDSAFDTLGMDPAALRAHLCNIAERRHGETRNVRTGRRLAAITPMHAFGHPVDMDALLAVSAEFDIPVVEDAAESLGSQYKNRPCGALGRIGALSFNGNKIATCGGGGALVTNDADLARRAKHLTTTAKTPHRWAFHHDEIAFNYRMPNINAALGCAQLLRIDAFLRRKRALAEHYRAGFHDFAGVAIFREPVFARSNYWLNVALLDEDRAAARDTVLAVANDAGVMCRPAWTLLHRLPMYKDCPRAPLPAAEAIESRLINIPSSARLGKEHAV